MPWVASEIFHQPVGVNSLGSAEKRLRLAAGSRPAELTSLRQQEAGVRRDSLRGSQEAR